MDGELRLQAFPAKRTRAKHSREANHTSHTQVFLPRAQPALQMGLRAIGPALEQALCHIASAFEQIHVGLQIGEAQHRQSALLYSEQLARTADAQVVPRDLEAVVVLEDDPQALPCGRRERALVKQNARA